ncbi:MAG: anti-sigma factor family protein [Candidatus Acidiferrales bacterium]
MTCKEFVDSLTEYLENALAPHQRADFEAHRVSCVNCQTYLEQMEQLIHAAPVLRYSAGEIKVPSRLYELLAEKTHAASVQREPKRLSYKPFLIAAVVIVILAGLWLYRIRYSAGLGPEAVTIDLTQRVRVRGIEQPAQPSLELPKAKLDLTVQLPIGAEPGKYQLGIAHEQSDPFLIAGGPATLIDHVTTLRVKLDLTRVRSGPYRLAVRPVSWAWAYYPLRIK